MSGIFISGSLPAQINENTPLWDWIGQLRLHINPALVRFVDLVGMGSNFFDVSLNRSTNMLTISPISIADHEWFVANNISATVQFSLRFFMTDGSVQFSQNSYGVTVLNLDDTPPQGLSFLTGGTVAAGVAGANIGRLRVNDPDTISGFTFTIREDDQWLFEVVGDMLRLRQGVSIPLADGPARELVITVSDGWQSSALTLSIGVTALGINNGGTVDLLESHESAHGFRWAGSGNLFSMRMSHEIGAIRDFGSLIHLQLRDGGTVTVEQPAVIDLLDGYISFSGDGLAGRVWAIYETVLNRDPRHAEMAAGVAWLANGATNEALVGNLLASAEFAQNFGGRSNAGFAELLYRNSLGWVDQSGTYFHANRLDLGQTRAKVATDFVNWRLDSLHHADQRAENGGFFVPRQWVAAVDQGGGGPTSLSAPTFGLWWADQIIGGSQLLLAYPETFNAVMGFLPQLSLGGSRLEVMFLQAAGTPAESRWAASLTDALQKTGQTPSRFLEDVVRDWDTVDARTHLQPQGLAFQTGW